MPVFSHPDFHWQDPEAQPEEGEYVVWRPQNQIAAICRWCSSVVFIRLRPSAETGAVCSRGRRWTDDKGILWLISSPVIVNVSDCGWPGWMKRWEIQKESLELWVRNAETSPANIHLNFYLTSNLSHATTICIYTDYKCTVIPQETMRRFRTSFVTSATWPHTTRKNSADGSSAEGEKRMGRRRREEEKWWTANTVLKRRHNDRNIGWRSRSGTTNRY